MGEEEREKGEGGNDTWTNTITCIHTVCRQGFISLKFMKVQQLTCS